MMTQPRAVRFPAGRALLVAAAALIACAAPLAAQRGRAPARPLLPAQADTNSAGAYMELGRASLRDRPETAVAAFYWASQIDPTSADALYGRYAAELVSDPRRLIGYMEGRRSVVTTPAIQRIDSLYFRALALDPFLYRRHETDLLAAYLRILARTDLERSNGTNGVDNGLIEHWIRVAMANGPPALRAQRAYANGSFAEALRLYDEALRGRGRKSWLRTERARVYALMGNDSAAAAEFTLALADLRGEDEREVVYLYESKALLEYGIGRLHERMGAADAARQAYGRALSEDLSFFPAHQRLAALAVTAGDTAAMRGALEMASQAAPGEPGVGLAHAVALAQGGDLQASAARLTALTQAAPYYAEPWLMLGAVRERQENAAGAAEAYRAFLARAPRDHRRTGFARERIAELDPTSTAGSQR